PSPRPAPPPSPAPTPAPNVSPVAKFRFAPKHPRARHRIVFDAGASAEPGGAIVDYLWNFGDRHKSAGRKVRHAFRKAGTHSVVLTVRDAQGRSATFKLRVRVRRR